MPKLSSVRRIEERPLRSSHSTRRAVTSSAAGSVVSGGRIANSSPPIPNPRPPARDPRIARRGVGGEGPADSDEAIVSGGVTVLVVQLLEPIEVEHDQRKR